MSDESTNDEPSDGDDEVEDDRPTVDEALALYESLLVEYDGHPPHDRCSVIWRSVMARWGSDAAERLSESMMQLANGMGYGQNDHRKPDYDRLNRLVERAREEIASGSYDSDAYSKEATIAARGNSQVLLDTVFRIWYDAA